ncbi:MAG: C40 family peptidase [Blastochloris sp.]|nr:C40 family peptidase [Blastochloris sp.]
MSKKSVHRRFRVRPRPHRHPDLRRVRQGSRTGSGAGACCSAGRGRRLRLAVEPASTLEETAWQLFVAATCPSTGTHPLTFENWTEQSCLAPGSCQGEEAAARQLHVSHLAVGLTGGMPSSDCSPMTGTKAAGNTPPSLVPFVPQNLAENAEFCEEVFANAEEVAFIREPAPGHTLLTLTQQAAYVDAYQAITFPTSAVEIKADWIPADALNPGGFDCSGFTSYVYRQFGVHLPHNAAAQFSTAYGASVGSIANLAPGDLVFFAGTAGPGISHVGLHIGGGRVVHALMPGYGVQVTSLYESYWISHYAGAIRPYR